MTMQNIPPMRYGPSPVSSTYNTITLDATSEYFAIVCYAPKTGTIDRVHFNAGTKTADGDGLRLRIETVSASTGLNTGTLAGGGSEVTVTTVTANSWNRGTAGMGASVTKGDLIAIVLSSPTSGTTFNGVLRVGISANAGTLTGAGIPYRIEAVPTATKNNNYGAFLVVLEYDDGTIPVMPGHLPVHSMSLLGPYDLSSTPDEFGLKFQVPTSMRLMGVSTTLDWGTVSDCDCVLYQNSTELIRVSNYDKDYTNSSTWTPHFLFSSSQTLSTGTTYRVVIAPQTGYCYPYRWTCSTSIGTSEVLNYIPTNWKWTERTNSGSWTDTDNSFPYITLIFDGIDDGASSGSGGFPATSTLNGLIQQ